MKTFIIKTFRLAIALLVMLGIFAGTARAQDYAVDGRLIGANIGVLAVQIIDRDVYAQSHGLAQPVTFSSHLFTNRHGKVCRNFVVFERRYGQLHKVVKTVCSNRHWQGHHRHHFRSDRHHHFRSDRHHFKGDHHHFRGGHRHHGKGGHRHHR